MNNHPTVSVLLPIFNGEKYVMDAIRSIQDQSYPSWELIIVDDGSVDRSFEICNLAAITDQRIKVYRNEINLGLAKTMNRLVQLSQGAFIAIQEQDDMSLPDRLECEINFLEAHQEYDLVSGIAEWLNDRGEAVAYFPGMLLRGENFPNAESEMVRFLFTKQCKVVNAACCYRRSIIQEQEPYDPNARMSIDWQFFIRTAHKHRMFGLPKVLVRMRRGKDHISLTKKKDLQFTEARRCIRLMYQDYKNDPSSPINYLLYRQAMATECCLEARTYGRWKGLKHLACSIMYDPFHKPAWKTIVELMQRGIQKTLKRAAANG